MLLDTHVVLWLLDNSSRLGPEARAAIMTSTAVHVSAASIWEIAIKASGGRLDVSDDLLQQIAEAAFTVLPVTETHAWGVRGLVGLPHGDPFDRLLVAQAAAEQLTFVTADRAILGATLSPEVTVLDARV